MGLWLVFALMTAAAIFAVLWPLSRRAPSVAGAGEVAVYRDQLEEIARDLNNGLIGVAEAQAARVEVSRRLLAAAETAPTKTTSFGASIWRRRLLAAVTLLVLPIGAGSFYLALGAPDLPGEPLAARLATIHRDSPIAELVARAEEELAKHPNDVRGYEVLAPVYLRLGRFADAVNACRKVIAIAGENANRLANLGVALTAAANGRVTEEARTVFAGALALDAKDMKARFFTGVAAKQDGDVKKAAAIWRDMLAQVPAGAPWVATLQQEIAALAPAAASPRPRQADMTNTVPSDGRDRDTMVRGMVARLAGRLKQNGRDANGWQRLLRAYMVLGERREAMTAAADARKALAGDPDGLRRVENMIKSLGLQG